MGKMLSGIYQTRAKWLYQRFGNWRVGLFGAMTQSLSTRDIRARITRLAEALEGCTDRVVTSFVDNYRTVDLSPLGIEPQTDAQKRELVQELSAIAKAHGMTLYSCAEELGLPASCCIDGSMFGVKRPKDRNQRGSCTCMESVDIGAYSTCENGCAYCYANHYGYVMPRVDPKAELLGLPLTGKEKIKQRN